MAKRIFTLILAFIMAISSLPLHALAESAENDTHEAEMLALEQLDTTVQFATEEESDNLPEDDPDSALNHSDTEQISLTEDDLPADPSDEEMLNDAMDNEVISEVIEEAPAEVMGSPAEELLFLDYDYIDESGIPCYLVEGAPGEEIKLFAKTKVIGDVEYRWQQRNADTEEYIDLEENAETLSVTVTDEIGQIDTKMQ